MPTGKGRDWHAVSELDLCQYARRRHEDGGRRPGGPGSTVVQAGASTAKQLRGDSVSNWFLRIAVLYIIAGVGLGIYMGASGDHSMYPVHAHLNLLGWVAMSLFGLFYRAFPAAAETKLAKAHFWIYVPAHLAQMVLLATLFRGYPAVEPVLGIFSMLVGAAFICFAIVVWRNTGKAA
jgi:hypothetical protein